MSEETPEEEEAPKKRSKLPLILALVVALGGGGGTFYAIYSGMILGGDVPADPHAEEMAAKQKEEEFVAPDTAFIELAPMVVSLGSLSDGRHLKFTAQLEVAPKQKDAVQVVVPRIMDVMNNYLRALRMADFEDPAALTRIRSQMLRRIQLITGPNAVRDLLITEFVMT